MIHSVPYYLPTANSLVNVRHDMKHTFFLTRMARSMLIAGMALGITGAVYAQGEGGGAGGAPAMGGRAGAAAGQAGGEMSGMSGLRREPARRERAVPGLRTAEPQGIPVAGPEVPPGKRSTSRASSRMEGTGGAGGE